ncbi:hypothetical protein DPMN_001050 [Dreissena polymorpha]|uniref:Uncharacterized protein n=1 Tax=Dreissena polymorpha TaxID=45954 RepID=A0A9D4MJ69_DREPO|nr:hypothetical protein DPMN_001050 [Dreissena polymorpha]
MVLIVHTTAHTLKVVFTSALGTHVTISLALSLAFLCSSFLYVATFATVSASFLGFSAGLLLLLVTGGCSNSIGV